MRILAVDYDSMHQGNMLCAWWWWQRWRSSPLEDRRSRELFLGARLRITRL